MSDAGEPLPGHGVPGSDFDGSEADTTGDDTHRGGFGEFGGDGPGLIDRAFRERIVLVGRGPLRR